MMNELKVDCPSVRVNGSFDLLDGITMSTAFWNSIIFDSKVSYDLLSSLLLKVPIEKY